MITNLPQDTMAEEVFPSLVTTSAGQQASATPLQQEPRGRVYAFLNGIPVRLGTLSDDLYLSRGAARAALAALVVQVL